jgi:hypothetical protein
MSHAHRSSSVFKFLKKEFAFLASLILFAIIFSVGSHYPNKFTSVEAQFTDSSASGLAIVPASCPSYPHVAGECSGPVTNAITISPNPIGPDYVNLYTITETSSDAGGVLRIQDQFVLINFLTNAPNYRGYIAWASDGFVGFFGGAGNMKDIVPCTGGGQGGIYNNYGQSYIDLVSCTLTYESGVTRVEQFVLGLIRPLRRPSQIILMATHIRIPDWLPAGESTAVLILHRVPQARCGTAVRV